MAFDPDSAPRSAFVLDATYAPTKGSWHTHRRAKLVHAAEGVLVVTTETGRWIAPPQRAVWVPGGMRHHKAWVDRPRLPRFAQQEPHPLGRPVEIVELHDADLDAALRELHHETVLT